METGALTGAQNRNLIKAIITAGLVVGTLDIIAASVQILIAGRDPVNMLKFIASGIFGRPALAGGFEYAVYGLFFHYCIATIWTTIFFVVYPRISFLSRHKIIAGVAYGIFVKLGMSVVVLPLSNTPDLPFTVKGTIISTLILIVAIGLPLSFLANRYYSKIKELR